MISGLRKDDLTEMDCNWLITRCASSWAWEVILEVYVDCGLKRPWVVSGLPFDRSSPWKTIMFWVLMDVALLCLWLPMKVAVLADYMAGVMGLGASMFRDVRVLREASWVRSIGLVGISTPLSAFRIGENWRLAIFSLKSLDFIFPWLLVRPLSSIAK